MSSPTKIRDPCLQMLYYRKPVASQPGKFVIDRRYGTVPPANYEDPSPEIAAQSYSHNTKVRPRRRCTLETGGRTRPLS